MSQNQTEISVVEGGTLGDERLPKSCHYYFGLCAPVLDCSNYGQDGRIHVGKDYWCNYMVLDSPVLLSSEQQQGIWKSVQESVCQAIKEIGQIHENKTVS